MNIPGLIICGLLLIPLYFIVRNMTYVAMKQQPPTTEPKRQPLPSDFMGPAGRKRGEEAMAKVPHFYVTSKSRSQADPALVQKAADQNRVVLYGVDSLEKLADRFEENEREIIRRHKEGKK